MKLIKILFMLILLTSLILVSSCSTKDAKVIECSNLIFDCDYNDCVNQCGKIATDKGKVLIDSKEINDGSGCFCEYEDAEVNL